MKYIFIILSLFSTLNLFAQANFWTAIADTDINLARNSEKKDLPNQYRSFQLDFEYLKKHVVRAPKTVTKASKIKLPLPMPDGTLLDFEIWESPIMEAGLANRYPNIKTYKGQAIDNPAITSRFGFSILGFHAMIQAPKGVVLIDPIATEQVTYYMVSYAKHSPSSEDIQQKTRSCGMPISTLEQAETHVFSKKMPTKARNNEPVDMYVYKLALACSGEFAEYHNANTKEEVLAHFTTIMNRANMVYERDLALRMLMINETDSLIFLDSATDPYTNGRDVSLSYQENPAVIETRINPSSFDIGHAFIAQCGSGVVGIGGGKVCDVSKSLGISCQFSSDANFAINIVAHEMGHQLYASHSWNNCPGNESNFSGGTAYEPGSGSTIMSYAGSCGSANNIQGTSDAYYHVTNLQQILNDKLIGRTNGCADITPTSNIKPVAIINYENGFYIPIRTPFELEGDAFDENGDSLTFCWEQYDSGPSVDLGTPVGTTPTFRSFRPTNDPIRTFPRKVDLLNNTMNVREVLPTYSRSLNFRLTVRDNHPEAGGVDWETLSFNVTNKSGPFLVNFPNSAQDTVHIGDYLEIKWEVAGTNEAPVNCQKVHILLSTDGGLSFPYVLAENTANDGSQLVSIPNVLSDKARIKIAAADNIFFDISNQNFEIKEAIQAGFSFAPAFQEKQVCLPATIDIPLSSISLLDFDNDLSFSIENSGNNTEGFTATYSKATIKPGEDNTLSLTFPADFPSGTFALDIIGQADGAANVQRRIELDLVANLFTNFEITSPANNTSGIGLPTFGWQRTRDANAYRIEIASNPAFGDFVVESADDIIDTSYTPSNPLEESSIYYWRVFPINDCGQGKSSDIFAFQTENLSCNSESGTEVPLIISGQGLPVIESKQTITQDFVISDLNVLKVRGTHDWVSHIRVSLKSPEGTEAILFSGKCPGSVPFNLGFDDESPTSLPCPPIGGFLHQPQEPLSIFDGENAFGEWSLKVEVIDGFGEGGSLDEWQLEFCGNITLNPPSLINNEILPVKPQSGRLINADFLLAEDANNTASELQYTIVQTPQAGTLLFNKETVMAGATFTQADIDNGAFKYRHDAESTSGSDSFTFTVADGEGGWIGITPFAINIDSTETTVSTKDLLDERIIQVFPNPVKEDINIRLKDEIATDFQVKLIDLQGRILLQKEIQKSHFVSLNIASFQDGIYFLKIQIGTRILTKKVLIHR